MGKFDGTVLVLNIGERASFNAGTIFLEEHVRDRTEVRFE